MDARPLRCQATEVPAHGPWEVWDLSLQVQMQTVPLAVCETLTRSFHFSMSQFSSSVKWGHNATYRIVNRINTCS